MEVHAEAVFVAVVPSSKKQKPLAHYKSLGGVREHVGQEGYIFC